MPDVSNNTVTYQAPVEVNRGYATLYLLLNGMSTVTDVMIVEMFKEFLKTNFETTSLPYIYTTIVPTIGDANLENGAEVSSGPFRGISLFNSNRLVAIKWVLKYKNGAEVPQDVLGNFMTTYRSKITPILSNRLHMDTVSSAFQPYGLPLQGDKGFPLTPPLPISSPTIRRRRRSVAPTPSPTPSPTPKPDIIYVSEPKKPSNAWLWVLGIGGGLYMLRRSW